MKPVSRPYLFGDTDPSPRTRVKICGLTNAADAAVAVELGADALGLNFYPASARCLDPARDGAWLRELPAGVCRVAVVVNATHEEIGRLLGEGWADMVQLHGDEDETFCRSLGASGIPFIKAIRVRDQAAIHEPGRFSTEAFLLDAFQPGAYGGTGRAVDWTLAASFAARHPRTILAGGLGPENVGAAIGAVRPYGIDVASGVEGDHGPRRKDPVRLRAFFAAVQAADIEKR